MKANCTSLIERIVALHEITLIMAKQTSVSELCRIAVTESLKRLDLDRLAVFVVEPDPDYMRGTWGTNHRGDVVDESDFRAPISSRSINAEALARRDLVAVKDPAPLSDGHKLVGEGWNAMVAMWEGDRALGWISADNLLNRRPFTTEDQEILKLLAASIGQMMLRVRAESSLRELNRQLEERVATRTEELEIANKQLDKLARTDSLTELYNRRELDAALHREWQRALRHGSPISVIAMDVDYFKTFNDSLGHQAGDDCLAKLASVLHKHCRRATDLAVRTGGEEFLLLLPDTRPAEARQIGQNLLRAVRATKIPHPESPIAAHVTVSLGIATTTPRRDQPDILEQADRALYRAKSLGRDRLEASGLA